MQNLKLIAFTVIGIAVMTCGTILLHALVHGKPW